MKTQTSFLTLGAAVATALLLHTGCQQISESNQIARTKLTVQFGWLLDAHHIGFLLAKAKGYYEAEGIDVEFRPGGLDSSPIKAVATGSAEIGQISGFEQLLSASSEGLPLTAVATFHRKSPHAIISLSSKPIKAPADIQNSSIAVAIGDAAEFHFNRLVAAEGLDRTTINVVPFRFDLTPLINGDVDGVTGFSTDQPLTLAQKGYKPEILSYSDFGDDSYGYALITTTEFAHENGPLLAKFLGASRRGWETAFTQPEAAIDVLVSILGPNAVVRDVELGKLARLRPIMLNESQQVLSTWITDESIVKSTHRKMVTAKLVATINEDNFSKLINNHPISIAESSPKGHHD